LHKEKLQLFVQFEIESAMSCFSSTSINRLGEHTYTFTAYFTML